jgi:hypothetical protein
MMYNTQRYWIFGLRPVTEVTSFYRAVSPLHLRSETDPVSETLCCLVSRILGDGQSPTRGSNCEFNFQSVHPLAAATGVTGVTAMYLLCL